MDVDQNLRLFAAIKGATIRARVRHIPADACLVVDVNGMRGERYLAPVGSKDGDVVWVAKSPHVLEMVGLGITATAAIADFIAELTGSKECEVTL